MMQPQQGPLPGPAAPPMQAPAQAPMAGGAAPPYRQLKVEDALAYLDQVKMKFEDKPEIYNQFLDIMKEFKAQSIDTPGVIERVLQLFHGHRMLILGFNTFLPPGYKIEFSDDQDKPRVQLKYPQGMTGPQPQPYVPPPASALPVQQAPNHLPGMAPTPYGQPMSGPGPEATPPPVPPSQAGSSATQNTKKAPIEFDQAINYVTKIKKTFEDKPGTYRAFLEILHTYQKEQKSIKDVYEEVSRLFKDHTELLAEFSQFLPDGSPEASGSMPPQPKGPKGKGAMDRGGGKPMARPGGKSARQQEEEEEHYWQKRKASRKEENGKQDRSVSARSPEAEFFSKCRSRMPKPMYLELLKCLNLYSQQIIDRSELLTLVHDLFKRTQIELFSNFRRLLGYSGGDARDAPSPPASRSADSGGSFRDLDFASMKKHGTSYRILPDDYQQPNCSGRGPLEQLVLNDQFVSVATGTEDLNFKTMRKNQYEESIFRAEDERFELDTTIETNMATLHFLRPIKAELDTMTEPEKRRYKLPTTTLSAMHCKAIRRLYGTQGMQVIELLSKCPAAAINPLVKRLTQKDEEWRGLRTQLLKGWKEVYEKNYTKSLDHRSFYFKQGDKKNFSGKQMILELKGLSEAGEPEPAEGEAAKPAAADKGEASAEPSKGLSLPFTSKIAPEALHDDTLQLMVFAAKLSFSLIKEEEIEEKLTEFWAGFVRPFFRCPELAPEDGAEPMDEDEAKPRAKPLLIVSADASEADATREARPPEQRWEAPLCYPKTSAQIFVGNSHFCIFARLYHVILERLSAAKTMASKAAATNESNGAEEPAPKEEDAPKEEGAEEAAETAGGTAASRAQLLASLRREANGDMYQAFLLSLRQLVEGKMEASVYEDVLRTLLGTDAYTLFTLQKIISQALKQLQMLVVEETSQKLLGLYRYERGRVAMGSMSEATYRNNARLLLEGDDCFQVEQLYCGGREGGGGELLLQFLPEKEAEEKEGEEDDVEEEEDEVEECSAVSKAEWSAYMDSYVQVASSGASSSRLKATTSPLLLQRTVRRTRSRAWNKAVILNGLECRAALGSCKLRFVTESEDLWYSNARRIGKPAAKAAIEAKRERFSKWLEQQPRDPSYNVLS